MAQTMNLVAPWKLELGSSEQFHPVYCSPLNFRNIIINERFQVVNEGDTKVPVFFQAIFTRIYRAHERGLKDQRPFSILAYLTDFDSEYPYNASIHSTADFLLRNAKSYEDCVLPLRHLDDATCFRTFTLILKKTQPPLFILDYDCCRAMERINAAFYTDAPLDERRIGIFPFSMLENDKFQRNWSEPYSRDRLILTSIRVAELQCHVFRCLQAMKNTFQRTIIRFILYHLCNFVYQCAYETRGDGIDPNLPYFVAITASYNNFVAKVIANIAWEVGPLLLRTSQEYQVSQFALGIRRNVAEPYQYSVDRQDNLIVRAMMNILCLGPHQLWQKGSNYRDFGHDKITRGIVEGFIQQLNNNIRAAEAQKNRPRK